LRVKKLDTLEHHGQCHCRDSLAPQLNHQFELTRPEQDNTLIDRTLAFNDEEETMFTNLVWLE
ncbi:hypothetical protein BgiMline_002675, partial [Biomphalaria glabrata]